MIYQTPADFAHMLWTRLRVLLYSVRRFFNASEKVISKPASLLFIIGNGLQHFPFGGLDEAQSPHFKLFLASAIASAMERA